MRIKQVKCTLSSFLFRPKSNMALKNLSSSASYSVPFKPCRMQLTILSIREIARMSFSFIFSRAIAARYRTFKFSERRISKKRTVIEKGMHSAPVKKVIHQETAKCTDSTSFLTYTLNELN